MMKYSNNNIKEENKKNKKSNQWFFIKPSKENSSKYSSKYSDETLEEEVDSEEKANNKLNLIETNYNTLLGTFELELIHLDYINNPTDETKKLKEEISEKIVNNLKGLETIISFLEIVKLKSKELHIKLRDLNTKLCDLLVRAHQLCK